jgi:hypothetical protein
MPPRLALAAPSQVLGYFQTVASILAGANLAKHYRAGYVESADWHIQFDWPHHDSKAFTYASLRKFNMINTISTDQKRETILFAILSWPE